MPKNSLKIRTTSEMNYVRSNFGMFLGVDRTPLPILKALLCNARSKYNNDDSSNRLAILVDTANKCFSVIDNGSGFPAEPNSALSKEHITKTLININKDRPHVTLSVINCLSSKLVIETVKDNQLVKYNIENERIDRIISDLEDKPYSTKITCYPDSRLFSSFINRSNLEEYLRVMKKQNDKLSIALIFDGTKTIIEKKKKRTRSTSKKSTTKKTTSNTKDKKTTPSDIIQNDIFKPKGKPFTETIYVEHMGDKVRTIGNVCYVYGKDEKELNRRIDIISSVPKYINMLKQVKSTLSEELKNYESKSKRYKEIDKIIKEIEANVKC